MRRRRSPRTKSSATRRSARSSKRPRATARAWSAGGRSRRRWSRTGSVSSRRSTTCRSGWSCSTREQKLIVANPRYAEIYLLPPDTGQAGDAAQGDRRKPDAERPLSRQRRRQVRRLSRAHRRAKPAVQGRHPVPRRPHHQPGLPADAGRRLGVDARGHHRPPQGRGEDRPHDVSRRADRPAQPHAAARAHRGRAGARRPQRAGGDPLSRPRPLQGRQRHARASDRRRAAGGGRQAPGELRARAATPWRGSAATNSPSSRSGWSSRRAPGRWRSA